jgi:hypothetical protein
MGMTGCRREAPPHGYTVFGEQGYIAARLYPRAIGMVSGGGPEGVGLFRKWRRPRVVPAVPEEQRPWQHPLLPPLRLLAVILEWSPHAVRCTMTGARAA